MGLSNHSPSKGDERFRRLLKSKAIPVTVQRITVLRALAAYRAPVSFSDVVETLASAGVERTTVYRNLLGLAEAGILIRSQLGDGVSRYELPPTGESTHTEHPHLVCIDCGSVTCLPRNTVSLRGEAAHGVIEVLLRGYCEACRRP